ncbi:DUF4225 domain-containing protein [Pseudomonas sp. SWI44]|uniref:DUF4225 domain-containing protein n=1 Tax=Pseudomonas sp. SWI44 TaxID=2083053 RepID=UPI000CE5F7F6|nr:DUF4225 domain-containing protein [Pseudomonas sp. SWI44]AVD86669.1 hypothetical protein C4Q26_05720 [Pseudomonas sp. SWI44]
MSRQDDFGERLDQAFWELNTAASGLVGYGCSVSARYLQDRGLRMQFNRELAYYARRVLDDVIQRRISPEEGLERIQAEQKSLFSEAHRVFTQVGGIAGGVSQVSTGLTSCIGSLGAACVFHGGPLIAHGGNNVYENALGLYEGRTDVVGPVREIYQDAAKSMGYGEREGNIAYYSADLIFSGRALWHKVPRKGAWRLYKYLDTDKERKYRQLGIKGLSLEIGASVLTFKQLMEEYSK